MHLKQLKLSGFKSFVDPTMVAFPSQLVGVVGPNGCGKSNIIDAVRWVMGESSAKNLRGESMSDVIFTGSSHRKPIGQASVELVFDNSLGRLTGQYASYQEIAIKRLVTRSGDSFYYLNGSRCRRRDITDIFLGTGAGARGYSIIGQEAISRLVEARPEELKAFLEEAAGISKYKERRKETLQRISHARENLARVADIREELSKQLERLERQAKAAERYKALKRDERLCKAEILALKWQKFALEQAQVTRETDQLMLEYEQHQSKMTGIVKENTAWRENLHGVQDELQNVQTHFYQLSTDIARLEEQIQQQQREKQRLTLDSQQLQVDLQSAMQQLESDTVALDQVLQRCDTLHINSQQLSDVFQSHQNTLSQLEVQKKEWDQQWQQVQQAQHLAQRDAKVEQVNIQHREDQYQHSLLRIEKIQQEKASIDVGILQQKLALLSAEHTSQLQVCQRHRENHQQAVALHVELKQAFSDLEHALHLAEDKVQSLAKEHAVLLTAQNAALRQVKNDSKALPKWEKMPRLAEVMTVPEEWLLAFEFVLGDSLQAIVLESMDDLWADVTLLEGHSVTFIAPQTLPKKHSIPYPCLSDKVKGVLPSGLTALNQIFATDTLAEALSWLPNLDQQQSIVTKEGYWIGPGWLKVNGTHQQDDPGLLSRGQALIKLTQQLEEAEVSLKALQDKRDALHADLTHHEKQKNALQESLHIQQEMLRATEAELHLKEREVQHALGRLNVLSDEYADVQASIDECLQQKMQGEQQLKLFLEKVALLEAEIGQHLDSKKQWEEQLQICRNVTDETRQALHLAELESHRETLKAQQLRENIHRQKGQVTTISQRLEGLNQRLNELLLPDNSLHESLQEKLALHHQWEEALSGLRQQVDGWQQQIQENEQLHKLEAQASALLQEKIQATQLHAQSLKIRADGIVETLSESNDRIEDLLAGMVLGSSLTTHEEKLMHLEEKIKRLGAINLMAIDEYQTESARKQHLDDQYQDLITALATLESAIAKMDKETQLRLKDTFEQVNALFQSLFPRLFGGGRAFLELTCDNLLEAGIVVMAQPPGKRNSSIHLLSGGEKAMTAVALVFAIFQLNPSPFCMLDEVDASLDDLNVRRFCDLVKEMSNVVQFLFITHNKITMELADHLIGVTMREPGVSRVVAVDVEEALSMAV